MRTIRVLRAMLACVMIWCLVTAGCSIPDDPDYDDIRGFIAAAPSPIRRASWRLTLVERAEEWLRGSRRDGIFLEVYCDDEGDNPTTYGWSVGDFLGCLRFEAGNPLGGTPHELNEGFWIPMSAVRSVNECLRGLRDRSFANYVEAGANQDTSRCQQQLSPRYEHAPIHEWAEEEIDDDELARRLISSDGPPEWLQIVGLAVVGSVIVVLVPPARPIVQRLCALGAEWSCPASPLYPPGNTPQPDQGDKR